jgi:hypothetical protein
VDVTGVKGKVPVVLRKDYVIYLELFQNNLWFHTDIYRWTPQVKRDFSKSVDCLLELVGVDVVALIREDNKKLEKFAKTFQWTHKGQINLLDGTRAAVYTSRKKAKGE